MAGKQAGKQAGNRAGKQDGKKGRGNKAESRANKKGDRAGRQGGKTGRGWEMTGKGSLRGGSRRERRLGCAGGKGAGRGREELIFRRGRGGRLRGTLGFQLIPYAMRSSILNEGFQTQGVGVPNAPIHNEQVGV